MIEVSLPELRLVAHQRLIYHITHNVRAIFMDYDAQEQVVSFLAYFQSPPTEWEEELISDSAFETAIEFDLYDSTKCIYSTAPLTKLEKLPYWLYVRAEELSREAEELGKEDDMEP